MVSVAEPAVSVACRATELFAATLKLIVALPLPLEGAPAVTQLADGVSVQAQSGAEVVRLAVPLAPAAEAENVVGLNAYVQPLA